MTRPLRLLTSTLLAAAVLATTWAACEMWAKANPYVQPPHVEVAP